MADKGLLELRDIKFVANQWIGVQSGYLGDFSYRTHSDFYPEYCGLDNIDPDTYEGTTRARFEKILGEADSLTQARILRGVLEKYPAGSAERRNTTRHQHMLDLIQKCESGTPIQLPEGRSGVEVALKDAEVLLANGRPVSAVDRTHTAFHGLLKALCVKKGIAFDSDDSVTALYKKLRRGAPELRPTGEYAEEIERILNSMASVIDCINTLRNRGSVAHPNENLLSEAAAMLFINSVRTIFLFLHQKIE
jgi:hypothetical protein